MRGLNSGALAGLGALLQYCDILAFLLRAVAPVCLKDGAGPKPLNSHRAFCWFQKEMLHLLLLVFVARCCYRVLLLYVLYG
eukprot:4359971-Amphidinium_carterae.1